MRHSRSFSLCLLALLWSVPAAAQHHAHGAPGAHETHGEAPASGGAQQPGANGADGSAGRQTTAEPLPPFIPVITDEDRAAAFPSNLRGHHVHDNAVNYFVLFDQFEWQTGGDAGLNWDTTGWIGQDRHRLWFRAEGASESGRVEDAEAQLFYGRAVARWWDVVAGVRQDVEPGPSQTWAAVGILGLAPQWFEIEATAYIGDSGRTQFRLETEYELLLTNRLVLQPLVELQIHGKDDPQRRVGAGLSSLEAGLRLRYELKREFAPYAGVTWDRKFFGSADYAEAAGESLTRTRFVFGVRFWR